MLKVLNCAAEPELRAMREAILRFYRCEVISVSGHAEAAWVMQHEGEFDVLVVCHQLERGDAEALCRQFKQRFPQGKTVAIETTAISELSCRADHHVNALKPAELIWAVTDHEFL